MLQVMCKSAFKSLKFNQELQVMYISMNKALIFAMDIPADKQTLLIETA